MKKTKVFAGRFFAAFLALLLLLLSVPTSSFAAPTIIDSGSCAKSGVMTWKFDSDGVLTIDGNGEMRDYTGVHNAETGQYSSLAPWEKYSDTVKEIRITDSVTNISHTAFSDMSKAEKVYFGKGVNTVGTAVFQNCYSLRGVYITDLSAWCNIGFYRSSDSNPLCFAHKLYLNGSLVQTLRIPAGVEEIKPYVFEGCSSIKAVVLPDSLLQIGRYAFYGCAFTSVTIPSSVSVLSSQSFYGCYRLQRFDVDGGNEDFSSDSNGVLFNKDKSVLFKYPEAKPEKTYTIPSSVRTIGEYAFYGSDWLEDVIVPESVSVINNHSFLGCSHLKNLYIYNASCAFGNYFGIAPTDYDGTVFHGFKDSTTEQYALVNNYRFEEISTAVTEPETKPSTEPSSEPVSVPSSTQPSGNAATEPTTTESDEESEENLNLFQRIIQWFRNLFAKLFGR